MPPKKTQTLPGGVSKKEFTREILREVVSLIDRNFQKINDTIEEKKSLGITFSTNYDNTKPIVKCTTKIGFSINYKDEESAMFDSEENEPCFKGFGRKALSKTAQKQINNAIDEGGES